MKSNKRTPWHVTLFAGAAWSLLTGSSVLFIISAVGGVLYLAWPKIKHKYKN